jgi:hypothetical protein
LLAIRDCDESHLQIDGKNASARLDRRRLSAGEKHQTKECGDQDQETEKQGGHLHSRIVVTRERKKGKPDRGQSSKDAERDFARILPRDRHKERRESNRRYGSE